MKARLSLLALISIICPSMIAAQQLSVVEERVANEEGVELPAWVARLDQDAGYCMDTYGDFVKKLVDTKVSKRGKTILVAEKVAFPELSKLRIDQRAVFTTESTGTAVAFMFSPGYDIHFGDGSFADEFKKAESFVKSYVRFHYSAYYNDEIRTVENRIKNLQGDIESNGKKTDRNNKSIADNKSDGETEKTRAKNEKMQRENESYAADTEAKRKEISELQSTLSSLNSRLQKTEAFK